MVSEAFKNNTHNEHVLWEEIKNVSELAINSAYGTDPRHNVIARAIADEIAFGVKIPWNFGKQFGRR